MVNEKDFNNLLEKVEKITKSKKLDLSSDEDLSIAIMNLLSIEEHLFFTAEKTNKPVYYKLLKEVREMRKELLKKIVKDYEGEVWCISKHLLASSIRLMEVGTKQLGQGKTKKARELFEKAYNLYSLFWALNLKIVDTKTLKDNNIISEKDIKNLKEHVDIKDNNGFLGKIGNALKKAIDCCKE